MDETVRPVVAVVVAAGSGSRLGASIPKALVRVAGKSLVQWAVASLAAGGVTKAVVTAPPGYRDELAEQLTSAEIECEVIDGGDRRQDSVRLGLAQLPEHAGIVLIHDAARPFVPPQVVQAVSEAVAAGAGAVIPGMPVTDSLRHRHANGSSAVDRTEYVAVQTPQGFDLTLVRRAHDHVQAAGIEVTDDAAACEAIGQSVSVVPGHSDALKITTGHDLLLAEAIAAERKP